MIHSKSELVCFLKKDQQMLGRSKASRPKLFGDEIWKFQRALRYHEYYMNRCDIVGRILCQYWSWRHHYLGLKLGFTIPCNVFGAGLNIHHYGCIVVNAHARVGENCCIQQGVNIGRSYNSDIAPVIGNNVYLGPGVKIFGGCSLADGIAVGANSVVTKSFEEPNMTIAGVPAKYIGQRKPGLQ